MRELGYGDLPRLMTLMTGDEKHSASAISTLDVLWTLYDSILRVSRSDPEDPSRDRFLLSKGHGPMALYAVLAAKGFIPVDSLAVWGSFNLPLGHHPDSNLRNTAIALSMSVSANSSQHRLLLPVLKRSPPDPLTSVPGGLNAWVAEGQ